MTRTEEQIVLWSFAVCNDCNIVVHLPIISYSSGGNFVQLAGPAPDGPILNKNF